MKFFLSFVECIFILFVILGCGGIESPKKGSPTLRALKCPPVENANSVRERQFKGSSGAGWIDSNQLKQKVIASCVSCHGAPARSGGFTFITDLHGKELTLEGKTNFYPGLADVMDSIINALKNNDVDKRMPPKDNRKKNPEYFIQLADDLEAWKNAGFTEGYFSKSNANSTLIKLPLITGKETSECVPSIDLMGYDYKKDRWFAQATELPKSLIDTDLYTIDSYELAQTGTINYSVEYPLWADNSEKGRWVHVPMKIVNNKLERQSIAYDQETKKFNIPENTRLYKTFYKKVLDKNGLAYFKRIETRIILVRYPWKNSLYGSYKWDETEQFATLIDSPYRDGSLFKDTVYSIVIDEKKNLTRTYGVPGLQRCIDCHSGSEMNNGVLGLTPLQLHRRKTGEGGKTQNVLSSEINQVERLNKYGVLKNAPEGAALPRLEWSGSANAKNDFDLRAAGYFYGNCAHCHNPNGIALSKEGGVRLLLTPGSTFDLNPTAKSLQIPTRSFVNASGDLDASHIWRKMMDPPEKQGLTSQMPMHTAGAPDCNAMLVMGQWIKSYESIDAAINFKPECSPAKDIKWIEQDFTWPKSEIYKPRRGDWADPINGMPEKYRQLRMNPLLQQILKTEVAVGYWSEPEKCQIPIVDLPLERRRPWMMKGDKPAKPFGEIYSTTPGSFFYRNSCSKCHGRNFDGSGDLAKGILNWSGGSIRVANFIQGIYGNQGQNLKTFDLDGVNYAGPYLIWMAMEGTKVQFPPEASEYIGKHGAQMLNQQRDKCLRQISTNKPSKPYFKEYEIYNKICFADNLSPNHPNLQFDAATNKPVHPELVDQWLDKASANAGWAIHDFLLEASQGVVRPSMDQCELVYPKKNEGSMR